MNRVWLLCMAQGSGRTQCPTYGFGPKKGSTSAVVNNANRDSVARDAIRRTGPGAGRVEARDRRGIPVLNLSYSSSLRTQ